MHLLQAPASKPYVFAILILYGVQLLRQLEEKIKVLEMNLAFLRWKIWYYQTAAEAGTESIHFIPGTTQVKPEIRDIFK